MQEEEEEEDGGTLHVQALEGAVDPRRPQKPVQATEREKIPDVHILPQSDITGAYKHRNTRTLLCCFSEYFPQSRLFKRNIFLYSNERNENVGQEYVQSSVCKLLTSSVHIDR